MSLVDYVIVGLAAGFLAGFVTRGRSFGVLGDLVAGIAGALLGSQAMDFLRLEWWGEMGSLVGAVAGAVTFLALLRFFKEP